MSKSLGAKVMSDLLKLWPKYTEEECEKSLAEELREGEKPTAPPFNLHTRHADNENGRIFYINEKTDSRYVIFYIHGGAYRHDILLPHWQLIEKLVRRTEAQVVVPAYRLVPFATYREAYDLIVPEYKKYCEMYPDKKIILMGDSAGGGLSLALTEYFRMESMREPDELILICPWVDTSMENDEIRKYETEDPFLSAPSLRICAERWAGDLDVHDWKISPIFGDVSGIHNVTLFTGTSEILYPDAIRFFHMIDADPSNELIVGEEMNHVYPLFPIKEAKPAVDKIMEAVMR
jgi:acetyl esterase/lipase